MSFLSGLLASIIEWFIAKGAALVMSLWKEHEAEQAIDQTTKDEADAEKNAKTPSELDKADADLLGH